MNVKVMDIVIRILPSPITVIAILLHAIATSVPVVRTIIMVRTQRKIIIIILTNIIVVD